MTTTRHSPACSVPEFMPLPAPGIPPGHPAIVDGGTGRTHTHGEIAALVRGCASGLTQLGVRTGDVVAVAVRGPAPFAAAFHGILLAGAVVQLLDPRAPAVEHDRVCTTSNAVWTVTADAAGRLRAAPRTSTASQAAVALPADSGPRAAVPVAPDSTAVLTSTSGTGGPFKTVRLTHRNLTVNLAQIHARHRLLPEDVVLTVTPLRHIYGMQMALNPVLRSGATLVTAPTPLNVGKLLALAEKHHVTTAYLVPSVIAELADHPGAEQPGLSALRWIFSGGAPLAHDAAQRLTERLGVPVIQGFGMTECGCTHVVPDNASAPVGSVGKPLPGTEAKIADARVNPDGHHEGELWVRGPQVSPGYLDGPHGGAPVADSDGWLCTGDLARVDRDGWYTVTGRLKELIKYKGHQVAPAELEALLRTHPAVADAAVVGVPDTACGELPKAFVVLRHDVPLPDLLTHVAAQVPPQRRIRLIEPVDTIPRSPSGKILRHELPVARPALGTVVVLTGAGRGLGREFAGALASAGATLVLTGRDTTALDRTAGDARARGSDVTVLAGDLVDPDTMARVAAHTADRYGGADVLVNNAGQAGSIGPLWECDDAQWWDALEVNVRGTMRACRAVLPQMIAKGGGRVVNIVSAAGRERWPHLSAYSVSKAALIKLGDNLAAELRPHHVAVLNYHPGLVDAGLTRDHLDRGQVGDRWADLVLTWLQDQERNGRLTRPADAARVLVRLVAGEADALSGRYLTVDDDLDDLLARVREAAPATPAATT